MCKVRFFFDWFAPSCIWSSLDETDGRFRPGLIAPDEFDLSDELCKDIGNLCEEYDTCLNEEDPAAETPWTEEHIDDFLSRATDAYNRFVSEIDSDISVENLIEKSLPKKATPY